MGFITEWDLFFVVLNVEPFIVVVVVFIAIEVVDSRLSWRTFLHGGLGRRRGGVATSDRICHLGLGLDRSLGWGLRLGLDWSLGRGLGLDLDLGHGRSGQREREMERHDGGWAGGDRWWGGDGGLDGRRGGSSSNHDVCLVIMGEG